MSLETVGGLRVPSLEDRATRVRVPPPVPRGLDRLAHGLIGRWARRGTRVRGLMRRADRLHEAVVRMEGDDVTLRERLSGHAHQVRRGRIPLSELPDAVLVDLMVAASRSLGLTPHPNQIMAVLGMLEGGLIEMATGEGKSLTAALRAVIGGWSGRPCHVITVNDYLARRDAVGFAPLFELCGLRAASVGEGDPFEARREAHRHDVVYTTAKDLLADFLRDRIRLGPMAHPHRRRIRSVVRPGSESPVVLRGLDTAIVDEADSVLIDEAVTPLIISTPRGEGSLTRALRVGKGLAADLERGVHFVVEPRTLAIRWTPTGLGRVREDLLANPDVFRSESMALEVMTQTVMAREVYRRDRHYVVQEGRIVIVDEFTGRMVPDRNFSHGLHQAIEIQENLEPTPPTEIAARLSYQRFFRVFANLCGISGTVREVAGEVWTLYEMPVFPIPSHRPCRRIDRGTHVAVDLEEKWRAIVADIRAVRARGRAVLVGTRSVASSEGLALRLEEAGIPYRLLNAVRHAEEAEIVAGAGGPGVVTIATNMAGRGTDIDLAESVRESGGLHVILAESNEAARVDRQLAGRCARQGDPGTTRTFLSAGDGLLERFGGGVARRWLRVMCRLRIPGRAFLARSLTRRAQARAQARAREQRVAIMAMDRWLEEALAFASRDTAY